jgi:hypothetical protein
MAEPQDVLCADGVTRRDTPEQAAIRARKTHAAKHPDKFWYHGAPYILGKRKGSPNSISARVKRLFMTAAEGVGLKYLERKICEAEATHRRLVTSGAPKEEKDTARAALDALLDRLATATPDALALEYLMEHAESEPKTFLSALARLLPQQTIIDDRRIDAPSSYTPDAIIEFYARIGITESPLLEKLKTIEHAPVGSTDVAPLNKQ